MTTTRLVDIKGAKEAFPQVKEVRVQIQNQASEAFRHLDIGHNTCVNEIEYVHLEVDVEAMVDLIAKYHFELGLRIKSGSKEVVSPSRELAQVISTNIPKWAKLVRK